MVVAAAQPKRSEAQGTDGDSEAERQLHESLEGSTEQDGVGENRRCTVLGREPFGRHSLTRISCRAECACLNGLNDPAFTKLQAGGQS
jgi:hypothetical protein